MNAELRVTADEQTHMIEHDLQLDEFLSSPFNLLGKDNLQSLIYRWHEHLTPVLRAKDDMIPADVDDVVVAMYVFHTSSITQ